MPANRALLTFVPPRDIAGFLALVVGLRNASLDRLFASHPGWLDFGLAGFRLESVQTLSQRTCSGGGRRPCLLGLGNLQSSTFFFGVCNMARGSAASGEQRSAHRDQGLCRFTSATIDEAIQMPSLAALRAAKEN